MSVVAFPIPNTPNSPVPSSEYQSVHSERDRLVAERTLASNVPGNESLLPAERITGRFTLFAVDHERSEGRMLDGFAPVCIGAIAGQAGIGVGLRCSAQSDATFCV